MAGPVLELDGLHRTFQGIAAVSDVHLAVADGTVHGLIGPNGAGKTTLFNLISGLVAPTAGVIRYQGTDITRWSPHRRARAGIHRVFQVTQLFRSLTVAEHLALMGRAAARRWVAELNLVPWLDRRPGELSFGVARLVELAMVLAEPARLILLDEPAAGLTEAERARLKTLLRGLVGEGRTILVVEHDLNWTLEVVDTLTVLDRGRIVASGHPRQVLEAPALRAAYLGDVAHLVATAGRRN